MHYLQSLLPQGNSKKNPISAEFRKELQQRIKPEIEQLSSLLDRKLDLWYQTPETTKQGDEK